MGQVQDCGGWRDSKSELMQGSGDYIRTYISVFKLLFLLCLWVQNEKRQIVM